MKRTPHRLCTAALCFVCLVWCAGHAAANAVRKQAVVDDVQQDGTLRTQDGIVLRIADVVFPDMTPETISSLRTLLKGRTLGYTPLTESRYGEVVSYLYDEDGARIAHWPGSMAYSDTTHAHTLQTVEADDAAQFRIPHEEAAQYVGAWRAVYGTVQQVALRREMGYLNFGEDYKTDFTLMIPPEVLKTKPPEFWQSLQGASVTARGMVYLYNGPAITLFNPDMLHIDETAPHTD